MDLAAKSGRSRIHVSRIVVGLLLVGAAGAFGLAMVAYGYVAPLIIVGFASCLLLLHRPFWGVLVLTLALPIDNMFVVGSNTGVKLLGLAVFGTWALRKLLTRESWGALLSSTYPYVAALFVMLAFASVLWAHDTSVASRGIVQLLMLFGWSVVVLDVVKSYGHADWLVKALVVGVLIAALATIEQYYVQGVRRAGDMVAGGINSTATVLATTLPFSFYLLRGAESRVWRLIGLAATVLSIIAGVVTFARMTLLVVPPLLLLLAWDSMRDRKARRWVIGLGLVALPVLAVYIPWERVHDRAQTIVPELTGGSAGQTQLGMPATHGGRVYHMKVGLAIALDHPLLGAGYENYGTLFRDEYQFTVPGSGKIYTSKRSAHSTYVGIVADLGVAGLALWFSVLFIALRQVFRTWTGKRGGAPGSTAAALPRAITYALLLYVLPYAWYIPHHTDKILWTLLGMSVAMGHLAQRTTARPRSHAAANETWTSESEVRHLSSVSQTEFM